MFIMLLVVFLDLIGFGIILPLLPFYGERFGASPLTVTVLLAIYSGMQLLSAPVWGRISDRYGRRPVLFVGLATSIASYIWMGHATTLWMLFATRALQGISAGNIAICQAYIADVTTPENRAKGMGMMGATFGLGFIFGPVLGGVLAGPSPTDFTVAWPADAAAAMSAVALILGFVLLKESLPPEKRAIAGAAPGRLALIADAFSRPRLRILMTLFFFTTFAFAGMESTFALWCHARFDWGPQIVGYLLAFVGVVLVLVQGGLVRCLSKTMPEARMLIIGLVGIAAGLVTLALAWTLTETLIANALLALGMGLTSPSISSLISREAGAFEQGAILGLNQSVGSAARLAGPIVAGIAFNLGGASLPYLLGGLIMIVPIVLAAGLQQKSVRV